MSNAPCVQGCVAALEWRAGFGAQSDERARAAAALRAAMTPFGSLRPAAATIADAMLTVADEGRDDEIARLGPETYGAAVGRLARLVRSVTIFAGPGGPDGSGPKHATVEATGDLGAPVALITPTSHTRIEIRVEHLHRYIVTVDFGPEGSQCRADEIRAANAAVPWQMRAGS